MTEQSGLFIKELEKRMSNQNKLRKLENKKIELVRKIQLCEHYKKEIVRFVQELNNQHNKGLISYKEYYHKLNRALDQKTPEQWIKEYDSSIWYYKHSLDSCEREIKKQENKAKIVPLATILAVFMILGFGFLFLKPTITGLIVGIGEDAYTQDISLIVNESIGYEWQPEHVGILKSARISGRILGEGSVRVYLNDKLILDSSKLEKSGISMITGLAISDLTKTNENVVFNEISENITNITEGTENITAPKTVETENITNITQEVPENITIPEEINVSKNITLPEEAVPELPEENITAPVQELPENITEIIFTDVCIETCSLELNKTSYELRFEIENAVLYLDSISYTIRPTEIPEVPKPAENISKAEEIIQGKAEINKPVKWVKKIRLNETANNLTIKLPQNISNVKVRKIIDGIKEEVREDKLKVREAKEIKSIKESLITGYVVKEAEEVKEEIELIIEDSVKEIEIEYETPAPQLFEEDIKRGKKIIISGPDSVHYENVSAYTNLSKEVPESKIRLYRTTNRAREQTQFTAYDNNNNSLIDYIEWIVPHLSEQTYELIIEISKAEHLDSEKQFISDIYEQVKSLDGIWSEPINNNEYVRVTFEIPLDNTRDITIYPRVVSGNPKIEVYEINGSEVIAEFTSINSNEYNKVYLTNLVGEQDVFDLRVVDGSIEIDHIIDPGWWNSSWLYRKEINITNVGSTTLLDFPAYINVTYNSNMLANYSDLRFISGTCAAGGSVLDYEIENYTSSNANIWVRIPNLGIGITQICLYYNNLQASSGENKTGVWNSNYLGVWHLSETSGNANDSTSNGKNGTVTGATRGVTGIVSSAFSFDGSNDYVDITINVPATVTISAWATYTGPGTDMLWCLNNAGTGGPDLFVGVPGSGVIALNTWDSWSNPFCNVPSAGFMQGWHLYTTIIDSASTKLYIDDTLCGTATYKNPTKTSFAISSSNGYDWVGKIDEVRISNVAETSDWVNQSYQMVVNQSVYVTFGPEEENLPMYTTLNSPTNEYATSDTTIIFNCSAETTTAGAELVNITLYHNYTTWHANETKSLTGTSNSTTFEKTFPEGTYKWNCLAYDNTSNSSWADSNYTFTIDKTPPSATINSPTGILADITPTINISLNEVGTIWYNINNGANTTICTDCSSSDSTYLHLAEGSYTIYVFANDSFGNLNNTESSSFTINMSQNYYDSYDDNSSIAEYNDITWNKGNVSFEQVTNKGDGSDGSLTVSDANTIINNYTYLTENENSGDNIIGINDGSAFSDGDEILIIQMQNGTGSGSSGTYEFRTITSGGGTNNLTLNSEMK